MFAETKYVRGKYDGLHSGVWNSIPGIVFFDLTYFNENKNLKCYRLTDNYCLTIGKVASFKIAKSPDLKGSTPSRTVVTPAAMGLKCTQSVLPDKFGKIQILRSTGAEHGNGITALKRLFAAQPPHLPWGNLVLISTLKKKSWQVET